MASSDSLFSLVWLIWPWPGFETPGDQLTTIFSSIVIVFAVFGVVRLRHYAKHFLKPLDKLKMFFEANDVDIKLYKKRIDNEEDFLKHRLETIIYSSFEQGGAFHNPVATEDVIDADSFRIEALRADVPFLIPNWGQSTLAALPSLLTAIGILGTFVGLVYGLDGSVTGGGVAIEQLIDGLKVSFRTSVWGLIGSIWLTLENKSKLSETETKVQGLIQALDSKFRRTSSERLLASLLLEQKEATGALKTLKTDLSGALQEAVARELAPTLNKLASSTEQSHAEGVGKVVEQVIANIGSELTTVAEKLETSADGWLRVSTSLREITQTQTTLAEKFTDTVSKLESSSNAVVEAHQHLNPVTERLASTGKQFDEIASTIGALVTEMKASGDEYGESVTKLTKVLEQQWGEWQRLSSHFHTVAEGLNRGLTEFAQRFPQSIEGTMVEFDRELAKVSQHLVSGTGELKESFDDLNDRIAEILRSDQA